MIQNIAQKPINTQMMASKRAAMANNQSNKPAFKGVEEPVKRGLEIAYKSPTVIEMVKPFAPVAVGLALVGTWLGIVHHTDQKQEAKALAEKEKAHEHKAGNR